MGEGIGNQRQFMPPPGKERDPTLDVQVIGVGKQSKAHQNYSR